MGPIPSSIVKAQSLAVMIFLIVTLGFGAAFAEPVADIAAEHGAVDAAIELPIEAAHDGDDHGVGGHHEEVDGLPQLDFTTYASQIFWMFVTFSLLYVFLAKKTLPEVSGVIESRREQIEGDLDNAQRLKEESEAAQAAYEKAMSEAREKASALFVDAENTVKAMTVERSNAFKDKAAKKIEATEKNVEKAKQDAMADTHAIAAEIASIAAEKIVGISTDLKQAQSLVKNIGQKAA